MSENLQHRRPEEPETYVEDVDKAFYMANSNAKRHEDTIAEKRKELDHIVTGQMVWVEEVTQDDDGFVVTYNDPQNIKQTRHEDRISGSGRRSIENTINYARDSADRTYDVASEVYDVLKRTKS